MLTAFYQTSSQLCFTLLGLWWLVLQTKYSEWIDDSARRHLATTISLYFLLPGSMSLFALLGADIPLLWRTSFAIASALGALATAPVWDVRRPGFGAGGFIAARWLGVALYLVVLTLSIVPGVAHLVHMAPLLPAGISLSLLIVLGVGLAWGFFLLPRAPQPAP